MTEMTAPKMVIQALADQGRAYLRLSGRGGAAIYDALFQQQKVRHILVRHEQGAVHAAEGYARSTGKVGCVLVTSGPGATNAVTGLADALMIRSRGLHHRQVPTHSDSAMTRSGMRHGRHHAALHKHNYLVKNIADCRAIARGFYVASSGRPRPGGGRHPEGHPVRQGRLFQANAFPHKGYSPAQGRPDKIRARSN